MRECDEATPDEGDEESGEVRLGGGGGVVPRKGL